MSVTTELPQFNNSYTKVTAILKSICVHLIPKYDSARRTR